MLGQERRCYKVNRAKREKTLPDVLSKEEIKRILNVAAKDLRFFCMFSILYSAGLRISELLELKPVPQPDTGAAGQGQERPLHAAVEAADEEAGGIQPSV